MISLKDRLEIKNSNNHILYKNSDNYYYKLISIILLYRFETLYLWLRISTFEFLFKTRFDLFDVLKD